MFTWNLDPVLVEVGPIEIRYYGVLFSLSLFLAYLLARRLFGMRGYSLVDLDSLAIYLVLGVIIGTRLGHILFYRLDYFLAHPLEIFQVWKGGLSSHGGAIGLIIAYLLFNWRHPQKNVLNYADTIACVVPIPAALIRLGNFMNSEIVGRPTDMPWGVIFKRYDGLVRHPSQLYEFLMATIILGVMLLLWKHKHKTAKPGFFVGMLFILYFSGRFLVEFFKEYPLHEGFLNFTTGQILSIPFIVVGVGTLIVSRWRD